MRDARFRRTYPTARIPSDGILTSIQALVLGPSEVRTVDTGIELAASVALTPARTMADCGVALLTYAIDADEAVVVALRNTSAVPVVIHPGDAVATLSPIG